MKCFYTIDTIDIDENTAVTVGKFEGLHPGHMDLIHKAGEYKNREPNKHALVMKAYRHGDAIKVKNPPLNAVPIFIVYTGV